MRFFLLIIHQQHKLVKVGRFTHFLVLFLATSFNFKESETLCSHQFVHKIYTCIPFKKAPLGEKEGNLFSVHFSLLITNATTWLFSYFLFDCGGFLLYRYIFHMLSFPSLFLYLTPSSLVIVDILVHRITNHIYFLAPFANPF